MILSAQSIRRLSIISPFSERTVDRGMTYGLGPCGYDIRIRECLSIGSGGYVLASSVEHFDMPADIVAFVTDKSSWARQGITVQNTVIEPGWRGYLTLEIGNHGSAAIIIEAGSPIAQIIFQRLDEPTESPYAGKYQDQPPKPVGAKEQAEDGNV